MSKQLGLSRQAGESSLVDLKIKKAIKVPLVWNLRGAHLNAGGVFKIIKYKVRVDREAYGVLEINYYNEYAKEALKVTKRLTQYTKEEATKFIKDFYEATKYESECGK